MTTHTRLTRPLAALPLLAAALFLGAPAGAQHGHAPEQQSDQEWLESCRRNGWGGRGETFCEVRETRLAAGGTVRVDGRENGGVSVRGWDRDEVLVRARVQANAPTEEAARGIARAVRVQSGGGTVRAEGPETGRGRHWSVSYEVFVPRRANLDLDASNGPLAVRDVSGTMDLRTQNGPLALRNVGGTVHARTTNGPLVVELSGTRWSGTGLDAETTNGPVSLRIPEGYNARLEAGNTHGPMNVDFPVAQAATRGRMSHRISTDLGRGGPTIRVITTNGPVNVAKAGR